jgi:competence protein ComEA
MRWVFQTMFPVGLAAAFLCSAKPEDLPDGKGKDSFLKMCTSCHTSDQVTSAKFPKARWTAVVDDMVGRGAEGSESDIRAVVGYLARNFGKPVNINSATARQIESDLSLPARDSEALVNYRTKNGAYKSYEDLLKVPGIDPQLLDDLRKNIQF